MVSSVPTISLADIQAADLRLRSIIKRTPLMYSERLSKKFEARVYLKREDLQVVRSYKIRGAYNKMALLSEAERERGVVCASAGNHAQGFALACILLKVKGIVFMPTPTPRQKIRKTAGFAGDWVEIMLAGDTFDDAFAHAMEHCEAENKSFVHPFDDPHIIAGQGTVGMEILRDIDRPIDYLFVPVGGGGLAAGIGSCFEELSPKTAMIGVEPAGAPAMYASLQQGELVKLAEIDKFVDGAAVKAIGRHPFEVCRKPLREMALVAEG